MPILAGFIMPHPPLLVEGVGGGKDEAAKATAAACEKAAAAVAELAPDVIVYITPHSVIYADYFHISPGGGARGDFAAFGAPSAAFEVDYDEEFVSELCRALDAEGISGGIEGERNPRLDHGVMVPMSFINRQYTGYKGVRVSQAGLDADEHYRLGMAVARVSRVLGRRTVIVASGDLSHKLKDDGPYGFAPEGPLFDERIAGVIKSGDFALLMKLPKDLCEKAGECGLRSFIVLAGAFDKTRLRTELLSYEGPFGVGYAVGGFYPDGEDASRCFLSGGETQSAQDPYVRLARLTLESYVGKGKLPNVGGGDGWPDELFINKAGVFVSLKKRGELRGCIGTIAPTRPNIAAEIMQNAISAGLNDSRFAPVTAGELSELQYSVDVLKPAEPVPDVSHLDVKKYGCIVSCGMRRGLLLPNLEGVDTVEEQVSIALRKGGIGPNEPYALERFEVVRHK